MLLRKRAKPKPEIERFQPARERLEALVDEFLDTRIYWREACQDVQAAYERWEQSEAGQRGLAYVIYRAALDREDQAARVYSIWTERVRAATALNEI
jgi:hypothetical protein